MLLLMEKFFILETFKLYFLFSLLANISACLSGVKVNVPLMAGVKRADLHGSKNLSQDPTFRHPRQFTIFSFRTRPLLFLLTRPLFSSLELLFRYSMRKPSWRDKD